MVDLSQYSVEELESMLGQPSPAAPSTQPPQPTKSSPDLSQYSAEQLQSMLGQQPATSPSSETDIAGSVAAALRGTRESLPFGQDIGAAATYLAGGNPLTGSEAPESFEEAKRQQVAQDVELYKQHPLSYGTGFAGGIGAQMAAGLPAPIMGVEQKIATKAAPYVGKTAGNLLGVAVPGAVTGAVYGAGEGVTPEERMHSAMTGAGLGAGLGLAAEGAVKGLQKIGAIGQPPKTASITQTKENLFDQAKQAYDLTKKMGLSLKKEAVEDFNRSINQKLANEKFRRTRNTELNSALGELDKLAKGLTKGNKPVYLEDLDLVNQFARDAVMSKDPQTRRLGGIFREGLDNFLENISPMHINAGDPKLAMASLKDARKYWKMARKTETLEDLINEAHLEAAAPNSTRSAADKIRTKLTSLIKSRKPGEWTDDEVKAMTDIINLHPFVKRVGEFDPLKSRTGAVAAGALALHNLPLAGALTGATHGARTLIERQTAQKIENLKDLIASEGKFYNLKKPAIPSVRKKGTVARQSLVPFGSVTFEPQGSLVSDNREKRASGGKISNRDYPAKRLSRVERALKRAQDALALETKPIMNVPDEAVAQALHLAKDK